VNAQGFEFEVTARDGAARSGRLVTPHGVVETPAFMGVATFGAVRGVDAPELAALGAQILLANTYHLHERPGEALIAELGGLHGFTGWRDRMRLREEGITFSSPLDGKKRLLTPESVIAIQEALGPDIAMVLDECQPPVALPGGALDEKQTASRVEVATERTLRWAERSARARKRADQAVFGIVQGGVSDALRRRSARATAELGFDGYAHGGLGLGEERARRSEVIHAAHGELPAAAPRYLMGLGKPVDLLEGVACGVDLFDCVVPTRNARHGLLFTSRGLLAIRNARFKDDPAPPDEDCDCPTCSRHSRAYLRHLIHTGEALGARLASVHNLRFYLRLLEEARRAIAEGRLEALRAEVAGLAGERVS
jgi:queuine tRNA-ribosyltransferase